MNNQKQFQLSVVLLLVVTISIVLFFGGSAKAAASAALVQTCIGCHGGDLTGGVGPNLHGLDEARIVDVLTNGIEGTPMTPGMKNEAEAKAIAEYISTLK